MTVYPEAVARKTALTLLLLGCGVPAALIAWQALEALHPPIAKVPGVGVPSEVQPNNITSEYLTAFARGWLTRRYTTNVYNYENIIVAASEDCDREYRIALLNQAKSELKRFQALEKSASADLQKIAIEQLGPGVWKIKYEATIKVFYASIQVPDENLRGALIVTQATSNAKHPVQVSANISLPVESEPKP